MLGCLNAREKEYKKGELIFRAGDSVTEVGLVEKGSVNIVVNFYWGNSGISGTSPRATSLRRPMPQYPGRSS